MIPPGPLTRKDLVALLPFFADEVVKVRVRGAVVVAALENAAASLQPCVSFPETSSLR
jgi:hypothetical protein